MTDTQIYDYTRLDTFQTCRKKYYWWGIKGLQTLTKSPALLFGGAIHDALDVFYITGDMDKGIAKFIEKHTEREGDDLRTIANGVKLLEWYVKVYPREPFKIIGKPEEGFVFPIEDVMYGGRMDLPIEWDDQLWIVEHKTTSQLSSSFARQFDLDKQVTGYIIATEEFAGRKCLGAIINVLQPWKQLKRVTAKSKTPEQHFLRFPSNRSQFLKDRFKLNVQRIVRDIRWCKENDEWFEAEKKDVCFHYNYDCPYKELCMYGEDSSIIERDYRVEHWNPYSLPGEKKKEEKNVAEVKK